MTISAVVRESFRRSISLYDELLAGLPERALSLKLPDIPSNTVGAQLWCVVGARESYSRAIEMGAWAGFSCSLNDESAHHKAAVQAALTASADEVLDKLARLEEYDEERCRFVVDLLEHEAAHQGQLIRYLYALKLPIPGSWKARYALD